MTDIEDLQDDVNYLMKKRMSQVDYLPDSVKTRTMGEANRFIYSGLEADLPSDPPTTGSGTFCYFAIDTFKLYIWIGTEYKSVTLS